MPRTTPQHIAIDHKSSLDDFKAKYSTIENVNPLHHNGFAEDREVMKPPATGPVHTLHVISFGYLSGPPSEADLIFNVSDWFRDPYFHEDLRQLTGLHYAVIMNVLGTEGVVPAIEALFEAIAVLAALRVKPVVLALGCRGGL